MSPHFGLMDAGKMDPAEAALLRAKLHWRGGCRRMRQQKTAAGIATLYDALLCGLRWYLMVHRQGNRGKLLDRELEDEEVLFSLGQEAGIFDESADPAGLRVLVEWVLEGNVQVAAMASLPDRIETILTRMGVLPFDERELPPEDAATY